MSRQKIQLDRNALSPEVLFHIDGRKTYGEDFYAFIDNDKNVATDYLQKIINMNEDQLSEETERKIWLSAFAANNPRSDYHYQCDACYDEWQRRNKPQGYSNAYDKVAKTI